MKINIGSRLKEAAISGKSYEEQLAEAKASGRPFGHVLDAKLGKHIIYHTPEEIADAQARTAAEVAERAARPKVLTMDSVEALLRKAGVSQADIEAAKT